MVGSAIGAFAAGTPVLLLTVDGGAAIVLPATNVTTHWIAWTVRHGSGMLYVALTPARADELDLPPMISTNLDSSASTVSVDAREGVSTGISARDRAYTIRLLAEPSTTPADLSRPGHVLPICVKPGERGLPDTRIEAAALSLCRLAHLPHVAVFDYMLADDGSLPRHDDVRDVGARFGIPVLYAQQLAEHVLSEERRSGWSMLPAMFA